MSRLIDAAIIKSQASEWGEKIVVARLQGTPPDQLQAMRQQRHNALKAAVFTEAGKLTGEAQRTMAAREQHYRAKAHTAADARESERRRDRIASMTAEQVDAAIHAAVHHPLDADYDDLATLGAEARRRGLKSADDAGRTLAVPQHEHDPEWQTAKADADYYTDWAKQQTGRTDVEVPGIPSFKLGDLEARSEQEMSQYASDRMREIGAASSAYEAAAAIERAVQAGIPTFGKD